jgi:hypothetical protein
MTARELLALVRANWDGTGELLVYDLYGATWITAEGPVHAAQIVRRDFPKVVTVAAFPF